MPDVIELAHDAFVSIFGSERGRPPTSLERWRKAWECAPEDWRQGVRLIAAALGEDQPRNLSCARLAEKALGMRAELDELKGVRDRVIVAEDLAARITRAMDNPPDGGRVMRAMARLHGHPEGAVLIEHIVSMVKRGDHFELECHKLKGGA